MKPKLNKTVSYEDMKSKLMFNDNKNRICFSISMIILLSSTIAIILLWLINVPNMIFTILCKLFTIIVLIAIGIIAICLYTSIIIKVKIDLLDEAERQNLEEDKNLEEDTSTWDWRRKICLK